MHLFISVSCVNGERQSVLDSTLIDPTPSITPEDALLQSAHSGDKSMMPHEARVSSAAIA